MNSTHRVKPQDKKRIRCQRCWVVPADVCEHVHWNTGNTKGLSFFYFCDKCYAEVKEKARAAAGR